MLPLQSMFNFLNDITFRILPQDSRDYSVYVAFQSGSLPHFL